MSRPPRDPQAPFLTGRSVSMAVLQGGVLLAVIAGAYAYMLRLGVPYPQARSLAFTALMLGDLALCWTLLTPAPFWRAERWNNGWFWAVGVFVMGLLELLRYLDFTAPVLGMPPLNAQDWLIALVLGLGATLWNEFLKIRRH